MHVLTKSALVLRDLDLLAAGKATVGVTITTPDEDLAERWEPAQRLRGPLGDARRSTLPRAEDLGHVWAIAAVLV